MITVKIAITTTARMQDTNHSGRPKTRFIARCEGKYQGIDKENRAK
jgi:hypothetical protein